MKKFLALTLSLLMAFSIIPMAISASADESTYTKVLDADNALTSTSFRFANGGINGTWLNKGGVIDYTTIDETYSDGNVYWLHSEYNNNNNFGFSIGSALYKKKVKSISFDVWADQAISLYTNGRTGIGNGGVTSFVIQSTAMGVSSLNVTTIPKTVTYDLSGITSYKSISDAWFIFCSSTKIFDVYFDNITITYARFAGTFTGGADGDQIVYADETGKLTTPNVTIADGEFAGWVTEADADNVIPADKELTIAEDTTYFAVSTTRESQAAPEAPVVESKTGYSVTLVANENYQYSKDGTTWQESNVFSGLSGGTEYTFYQRLKATPTKYASPASEGTTVTTNAVYKWNLYSTYFTINSGATLAGGFSTTYQSDGTYFVSTGNAVGATATLTSLSTVKSGVYSVKFYARTTGARANIDISINGTKVASALNTGNTGTGSGYDYGFQLSDVKIIAEDQPITLTITTTTSGNLYLNSLELTKITEVEKDGTTTTALSTDAKASIRLNDQAGIRFYTTFDVDAIEGTVVEKGTLIGPANLIGDYLTIDDVDLTGETVKNAVAVKYEADTLWENNEFVGSIVGINSWNYNREFTARAYVKLDDGTYLYSAAATTKTVAEIADAYIADSNSDYNQGKLSESIKALVDDWAAAND